MAISLLIGSRYKKQAQQTEMDGACAATRTMDVATDQGTRAMTVTAVS